MLKSQCVILVLTFIMSGCFGMHHRRHDDHDGRNPGGGNYERCVINNMRNQPSDQILPLVKKECQRRYNDKEKNGNE